MLGRYDHTSFICSDCNTNFGDFHKYLFSRDLDLLKQKLLVHKKCHYFIGYFCDIGMRYCSIV